MFRPLDRHRQTDSRDKITQDTHLHGNHHECRQFSRVRPRQTQTPTLRTSKRELSILKNLLLLRVVTRRSIQALSFLSRSLSLYSLTKGSIAIKSYPKCCNWSEGHRTTPAQIGATSALRYEPATKSIQGHHKSKKSFPPLFKEKQDD